MKWPLWRSSNAGREAAIPATTVSFMAVAVRSAHDKRGLATTVLRELTRRAHEADLVPRPRGAGVSGRPR